MSRSKSRKRIKVWAVDQYGYAVTLWQHSPDYFDVTYGHVQHNDLAYGEAAHKFGECLFHLLACEGFIKGEGE